MQASIAGELSWLEEIKNSKGNTEANTIKQTKAINDYGVYEIGIRHDAAAAEQTNEYFHTRADSLNDIVRVDVPKIDKNGKRLEETKVYTFQELVDLRDKLTLIVTREEEQQEINRYFEDVTINYYNY